MGTRISASASIICSPSSSQDIADKMKIFFVAILVAFAAAAEVTFDSAFPTTSQSAEVTLEDLARSYMRIGSEFSSMTDGEKREAMQRHIDDYFSVLHGDLFCDAAVEDINKIFEEQIIKVYLDLDYEERKAFLNSYNLAFWKAAGIKHVEITTWNWLDNSGPTLSRYAMYCHARQQWNHQPDFGYCLVGNRTEDRGAELSRRFENRDGELG